MEVSVVIPTFNRGHVVGEALQSVLAQTFRDFEVIVVDDASRDDTQARLNALRDPRVRYLRHATNRGVSAARNTAVAQARGAIVAFLDSDDLWKPDKLEHEIRLLAEHPDVVAVFDDLEKHDGSVFVPSFMRESPVFSTLLTRGAPGGTMVLEQREMFLCLLQEVPILPSAFTIRRQAFERAGGFDETWRSWEDWEFFLRVARLGPFGYVDRPLAVLRVSGDSLHRVDSIGGRTTMLQLLLRERKFLDGDREAAAAVKRGVIHLRRQLGWRYEDSGQYRAAVGNYLRGFREVGSVFLLLRAGVSLLRWARAA